MASQRKRRIYRWLQVWVIGLGTSLAGQRAIAQSGETPIYKEQFAALVQSMDRVYSSALKVPSGTDKQELMERVFALQKSAHRLQEQAGEAENQSREAGHTIDKRLLLIEQGCMSVDLVLAATNNFLSTGDRVFVGLASDVRRVVSTVLNSY